MSGVSIKFRPVTNQWDYITGGTQFHDALKNLFGVPCVLSENNIPQLEGISACGFVGANELIHAINECGEIEIKAEY